MKPSHKLETPREETLKKMRPVKREEFTALVQKAIHTPSSKKSSGKLRGMGKAASAEKLPS
jgi:hypothetical protein